MNSAYRKFTFVIMMAVLLPLQAHGYISNIKSALMSVFALAKSACGSTYSLAKSYAGPAVIGVTSIVALASVANYAENTSELELLRKIMADLDEQQKNKSLAQLSTQLNLNKEGQEYRTLADLMRAYNQEVMKVSQDAHPQVIDYYRSFLAKQEFESLYGVKPALQEFESLYGVNHALQEKGQDLLDDPRCEAQVGFDDQRNAVAIKDILCYYLPQYDQIIKKHFDPGAVNHRAPSISGHMSLDQADSIINELDRACNDCIAHIDSTPIYKHLNLTPNILKYLNELKAHANAVKKNLEAIEVANKVLADRNLGQQPSVQVQNMINKLHALRKHVACMIDERSKRQRVHFTSLWQSSAVLLGAVAAVASLRLWNK